MDHRIAVIAIVVSEPETVEQLNAILHSYAAYTVGRMGLPMRERKISLISLALDAPQDIISALAGKLGRLPGVSAKTVYAPEV